MGSLDDLLDRLEQLLTEIDALDEGVRRPVLELLDGIDSIHRLALGRLPDALGPGGVERLRQSDPALQWLLDTYAVGVDERAAAERALDQVRPYIHSHGGEVEVLAVREGTVSVRMSGACSGCTASAITLREGVERALREGFPGFAVLAVEEDEAEPHPPPGATLLQLEDRLSG